MVNSERGEHIGISAPFENIHERNNTLHVFSTIDKTRNIILDEVNELSVPGTHLDWQPHTHHSSPFFEFSRIIAHKRSIDLVLP